MTKSSVLTVSTIIIVSKSLAKLQLFFDICKFFMLFYQKRFNKIFWGILDTKQPRHFSAGLFGTFYCHDSFASRYHYGRLSPVRMVRLFEFNPDRYPDLPNYLCSDYQPLSSNQRLTAFAQQSVDYIFSFP